MLSSDELITFEGEYYRYNGLRTYTRIPLEMMPRFFVASATASSSGLEAASKVADVALTFPLESDVLPMRFIEPLQESGLATGLRFKIVARSTGVEAHQAASEADPYYKLRIIAKRAYNSRDKVHKVFYPALMGIKTDCPVFIGSYEEVSAYLSGYVRSGVRNVILAPMELNMEHAEYTMNMVLEACGMG
jgi:alkanesulfonate monooxygenase SsuD/methylene tetrahydromethanopterin reductase-like flavin-dependent oxidoreductase (luciferase family)